MERQETRIVLTPRLVRIPYATKLQGDLAKEVVEQTNELVKQNGWENVPDFQTHWTYNEATGEINGSNPRRLILVNQVLSPKGYRTLTSQEGMELDSQKALTNGVLRDFDWIIYDGNSPNADVAKELVKQAKERSWSLPILAHPSNLELTADNAQIGFSEDDSLILQGDEAHEVLSKFNYKANSGVRWAYRDNNASWIAYGDCLPVSDPGCRVDWIRAEGARSDFTAESVAKIEKSAQAQQQKYLSELSKATDRAIADIQKL